MKYRDPMGVELKVGQKVVYPSYGQFFPILVGTIKDIDEAGNVTVTGLCGGTQKRDHLAIYVVGLDKS